MLDPHNLWYFLGLCLLLQSFQTEVADHAVDIERVQTVGQDLVSTHQELRRDVEKTLSKSDVLHISNHWFLYIFITNMK